MQEEAQAAILPEERGKLTEATARTFCTFIRGGQGIRMSCAASGISHQGFYNWMKKANEGVEPYATFKLQVEKAQAEWAEQTTQHIDLAAARGDWRAAAWRLERALPSEFGKEAVVRHVSEDSGPERGSEGLSQLSTEEKWQLKGLLAKARGEDVPAFSHVVEVQGEALEGGE